MDGSIEKDLNEILNKPKLDKLREKLAAIVKECEKPPLIHVPYKGKRKGYFVYHPKRFANSDTAYLGTKAVFLATLHSWYDVLDLYHDDSPLHEKIATDALKKSIQKIMDEAEKARNPYVLEALAEMLWDREGAVQLDDGSFVGHSEKTEQHDLSYMRDILKRAEELRHEDLGITLDKPFDAPPTQHGWGG